MDIAVRAHLHGWKFIFLNDVEISIWKKANIIFLFFLLRKLVLPFYSFTLFLHHSSNDHVHPRGDPSRWNLYKIDFRPYYSILPIDDVKDISINL
ncbi:hypothetical protein F511_28437 [Dorcoceras hygrometricum]|uniref:Uncharacterized protein n=1 Tax=Dorcoceras hygrometricum TaxID=472368 RepID=A0A2Z7BCJ3_9LAMI|nr:hypothetical protein F511_28437 [Dorcoceras hygrometricum]